MVIGVEFIDQFPDAGKPFKTTAPSGEIHVGCVIVPITGADGLAGIPAIEKLLGNEVHPSLFVTETEKAVPAVKFDKLNVVPVPVNELPGVNANVHVPDVGKPLIFALPVVTTHVGLTIEAIVGAVGVVG